MSEQTKLTKFEQRVREYQEKTFGIRYAGATLSELRHKTESIQCIMNFINHPKNFLVLISPPGVGKTYFCAALTEWIMKKFNNYRYMHEKDFFKILRQSISSDLRGDYLTAMHDRIDVELLIYDDLGSQGKGETSWREEIIFDLIDFRYNCMKPTIITTNLSKEEIKQNYHYRIYSRLFAKENIIIDLSDSEDKRTSEEFI